MKKILSCVFAFLICAICVAPIFSAKTVAKAENVASSFIEDNFENKQDILSVETKNISGATTALNNAPFNNETKQMMSGYVITPKPNRYGEQSLSLKVNDFVFENNKSVYMWIYVAELLPYDFKLTFYTSDSKPVCWTFESGVFLNMIDGGGTKNSYGWKLFEFKFSDAVFDTNLSDVNQITLKSMNFSFAPAETLNQDVFCEGLSFYHVFLADSLRETSGVVYYQKFTNYQIKQEFSSFLKNIYVGDDLKINGIYDIFEYVVVGKYDLKNYSNLKNYTWNITYKDASSRMVNVKFGEIYTLEKSGWHSLTVKLTRINDLQDEVVLNVTYSFHCNNFGMGSFFNKNYFFDEGTTNVLVFKFSDDFVLDSNVSVFLADKNTAKITEYYIEDKQCYITVSADNPGNIKLTIEADGHRDGYTETSSYSYSTTIYVNKINEDAGSKTLLIVIFCCFCATIVIILVILFVKARRFGVK